MIQVCLSVTCKGEETERKKIERKRGKERKEERSVVDPRADTR